jgi:hypothetical protein
VGLAERIMRRSVFVLQLLQLPGFKRLFVLRAGQIVDRPHTGIAAFIAAAIEGAGFARRLGRRGKAGRGRTHLRILMCAGLLGMLPAAQAAEDLLPLLAQDLPPGCGCQVRPLQSPRGAPVLVWSGEGRKDGWVRVAEGLQTLSLRDEKHIPARPGAPRPGDRFVLYLANGDWQAQVLGLAEENTCGRQRKTCSQHRYRGRLLLQHQGGARRERLIDLRCDCP